MSEQRHPSRWIVTAMLLSGMGGSLANQATPVIVAEAKSVPFEDRIEALGTLRANESVALTASETETVTALHFDDGDRVKSGTVLVEMTSAEEHALLEEAKALVAEAERQYQRVQSLEAKGTAARSLLDERRREWQTARARLIAIESRLSDRLIKAPFSGVVGLRNISVGALVEPGDLITTLDDDGTMKLDLGVPSVFLAGLAPGLPIVATTSAFGSREFHGEIKSLDSRVDPVTRSIQVRALVPNGERLLRPGMLMQVTLSKDVRQTLMIPEASLMPLGQDQWVLLAVPQEQGYKAEKRRIRIGSRRPGWVEVLEGLEPGDRVITHGGMRARPGQAVEIRAVDDGSSTLSDLLKDGAGAAAGGTE